MITTEEAERIDGKFADAFELEKVSRRQAAEQMYEAWQELYALMGREIIIRINWEVTFLTGRSVTGQTM